MQVQFGSPIDLKPAACVVLRAAHVRRNQEALILGEELCLPVAIDGVGAVHKAVGDRTATG